MLSSTPPDPSVESGFERVAVFSPRADVDVSDACARVTLVLPQDAQALVGDVPVVFFGRTCAVSHPLERSRHATDETQNRAVCGAPVFIACACASAHARGAKLLVNDLFALSESANAYVYERLSVAQRQPPCRLHPARRGGGRFRRFRRAQSLPPCPC